MMTEKSIIDQGKHSGKVSWTDSKIKWHNPYGLNVIIDLDEVVVIGEYRTATGLFFADWFMTFVYRTGDWDSFPVHAKGIDALKQHLSKIYAADLSPYYLADSIQWQSYISYPKDLKGKLLFNIHAPRGYTQPETLFQKLKSALGLGVYGKRWQFDLSNEVKSKLNSDGS